MAAPSPKPSASFRWAVGVTTCTRPEPTLERTIDSLIDTGFTHIDLFNDGPIGSSMPKNFFSLPWREDVRVHDRPTRIGAYGNFLLALSELVQTYPTSDAFLMVQDDVIFAKNCRQYLEATLRNDKLRNEGLVWSLYCSGTDYDLFSSTKGVQAGWQRTNRGWGMMGALTVVFTLRDAISFLSSLSTWMHRIELGDKATRQVDAEIGKWASANFKPAMFHHPSLAQHIGEHSAIYKSLSDMSDRRSSPTFVGQDFDAMSLLPYRLQSSSSVVSAHASDRLPEKKKVAVDDKTTEAGPALRYGVYGSLGLSPDGFATARLLDIEQTKSVLCVNELGFPVRGGSFDQPITFCQTGAAQGKIASAFKNVDVVFAIKPLSKAALSYCKARDLHVVPIVFRLSEDKKAVWKDTLKASSLVLTPFEPTKVILDAWGARNALQAIPEALAPILSRVSTTKSAVWACDGKKMLFDEGEIVFTNTPARFGGKNVFDLTKEDHDSFLDKMHEIHEFRFPVGDGSSINAITPYLVRNGLIAQYAKPDGPEPSYVSADDLSAFLKERMRRY